jgi:hypothetical protein
MKNTCSFSRSLFVFQFGTNQKISCKATATAVPVKLNNITDSLNYIGIMVAGFYKQQGIKSINNALVNRAIQDKMKGDSALLTDQQCNRSLWAILKNQG